MSLPGWLYHSPEFLEAEKHAFLRAAPQVVCHESEIALAGEWRRLDYLGGPTAVFLYGIVTGTLVRVALVAMARRFGRDE